MAQSDSIHPFEVILASVPPSSIVNFFARLHPAIIPTISKELILNLQSPVDVLWRPRGGGLHF